jgi:tetratricopeptide (TPR) repeat protein
VALADTLRGELARRDADRSRRERAVELIDDGKRLQEAGRLAEAAARFREAVELAPDSGADDLLSEVQAELASRSSGSPADGATERLGRAETLIAEGELRAALGLVQQVLASEPENARAADLERRLLAGLAEQERAAELDRMLGDAQDRLSAGDLEGAIATANLVLARDRGNAGALRVIQTAYASLSRRLLGEGPAQNLPPAIRFADLRDEMSDGSLVHVVRDADLRLSGVVIDDSVVALTAADGRGQPVETELTSQVVGDITITEFRLELDLAPGMNEVVVVATDAGGLSSRGDYAVEYRRPLPRSPRMWGGAVILSLLAGAILMIRRAARRRSMLRRRFNPFVAGPPVLDPDLFVGRDALMDRVLATVPNNSLLLLGERRIGKTSILQQLRTRLLIFDHPRSFFIPVSVDLQGVAEDDFFAVVAEAVGEAIGDESMTAARTVDRYDSRELTRDLRRALPGIEKIGDRRAKIVLLLDEIDELNGYSHRTNQRLRSLFMRSFADQLVAVAAGVGIAREWDHEGSPWYNFFEEIEVGPLTADVARRLVIDPLEGVITIDGDAVDLLIDRADGRPYILQKAALAAVQRVHERGRSRMTRNDVECAFES